MKGGRGRFRELLDDRWRENASRPPSPYYKDSNSESGAPERWNSTQEARGVRGNYRSSGRGRGALGGRGGSFKGGRSSSDFRGNRFGEDGRVQDSRERFGVNSPKTPRRGQLFEGEEKWQRKVRKKKAQTSFLQDYDESLSDDPGERGRGYQDVNENNVGESEGGDEGGVEVWRRKKIGWLCKEIPALRPGGIVTMLNSQRKWIKAVDAKEVVETLMRRDEILRAYRVLKWTMQQPWYENDFDLNTKMVNTLGTKGKLMRMRELFDTIIATGAVPDISTYIILIKADIADGSGDSLDHAFAIYNQMEQLGGYQQPAALAYTLSQAFTDRKGATHIRNLLKADALFENMRKKSVLWCMGLNSTQWAVIFSGVIHMHSFQGNVARVKDLVADMKEAALPLSRDCYTALIRVAAKDGNITEAESVFKDLLSAGHQPDWRSYISLIETYGAGGLPDKVQSTFDKMVAEGIHINLNVYQAVIKAMIKMGSIEGALSALEKAEEKFSFALHNSYNLLMEWYRSKDMLVDVEVVVERMKEKKCRPNLQAYNNLIESFILRGQLDKAEGVYEDMNNKGFQPNLQTYCLMIEAFSRAERHERVKDCYALLTERKMQAPRMEVDDDLGKKYHFSTVSHVSLQFYAQQYRPEGQPVIPRLIHRWLNPLSLAYWYMYGGEKCKETRGIILNACQYTSMELTLVVKSLKAGTVDCFVRKRRSGNVLCFTGESAARIWKLMEPHILDEVKDLLRPDISSSMDDTGLKDEPEAFDDELELKVTNEDDLVNEDNFMRTDIGVTYNNDSDLDT
uniref:Pentacotripeptide-repeat region of PRORP domain-containing protein n=1 Tax=Physcomitrium patens TaxID=3218 RepID=A0A7I4B7M8_PHYPA